MLVHQVRQNNLLSGSTVLGDLHSIYAHGDDSDIEYNRIFYCLNRSTGFSTPCPRTEICRDASSLAALLGPSLVSSIVLSHSCTCPRFFSASLSVCSCLMNTKKLCQGSCFPCNTHYTNVTIQYFLVYKMNNMI